MVRQVSPIGKENNTNARLKKQQQQQKEPPKDIAGYSHPSNLVNPYPKKAEQHKD